MLGLDTWAIQPGCAERPSGALPGNGCPRAHSSGGHLLFMLLTVLPSFWHLLSYQGAPNLQSYSLNRALISLGQEFRA